MKLRIYLDTSVFSAYLDDRTPDRMAETREFWERLPEFDATVSELVRSEIVHTVDPERRSGLLSLMRLVKVETISGEMEEVARMYVKRGLFAPAMYNDALHVAAAIILHQDILVSWNYKHLVNRRKRAQVADVNIALGLPNIEIISPSEL